MAYINRLTKERIEDTDILKTERIQLPIAQYNEDELNRLHANWSDERSLERFALIVSGETRVWVPVVDAA